MSSRPARGADMRPCLNAFKATEIQLSFHCSFWMNLGVGLGFTYLHLKPKHLNPKPMFLLKQSTLSSTAEAFCCHAGSDLSILLLILILIL